jgi:hypothetical protein
MFDIERRHVENDTTLWIQLMDDDGNWLWYDKNYVLPEQLISENDGKLKYLTIRDKRVDSLVPTNNENEWCGWEHAGIFEKQLNRPRPHLPDWYIDVPKLNEWDSWFYSHAKSRFVYDISGGEYTRFVADLYLPNPCGVTASIEIICFANDEEIYRSGILRPPAAQNKHLSVNIPKDTQEFTIQVTDAGDGITCDHFVFGNAQVLNVPFDDKKDENVVQDEDVICVNCAVDEDISEDIADQFDLAVNPTNKLTTKWAVIKARK